MQLDHGTHVYQQLQQLPQKKQKNRQVKYRSNSVDLHLVRIFLELKLW